MSGQKPSRAGKETIQRLMECRALNNQNPNINMSMTNTRPGGRPVDREKPVHSRFTKLGTLLQLAGTYVILTYSVLLVVYMHKHQNTPAGRPAGGRRNMGL
jgi:hypothetical protein